MVLRQMAFCAFCVFALVAGMGPMLAQAEFPGGETGMSISEGNIVSLEYTLKLEDKEVLDTNVGGDPLTYTQGAHQIIPGLESALVGMKAGESKQVTVTPKDGYGEIDEQRFQEVPIEHIPPDARKAGTELQGTDPNGQLVRPVVKEVKEQVVVLDFNHRLAGKTLYFEVKVLGVQPSKTP